MFNETSFPLSAPAGVRKHALMVLTHLILNIF